MYIKHIQNNIKYPVAIASTPSACVQKAAGISANIESSGSSGHI